MAVNYRLQGAIDAVESRRFEPLLDVLTVTPRIESMRQGLRAMRNVGLVGRGLSNREVNFVDARAYRNIHRSWAPHNAFIVTWLALGVVPAVMGLFAAIAVIVAISRELRAAGYRWLPAAFGFLFFLFYMSATNLLELTLVLLAVAFLVIARTAPPAVALHDT